MTAVEWLVEQLIPKAMVTYDTTTYNAVEQAKAMEKEQILKALYFGKNINDDIEAEQYYNENYKQ